MKNCLKISKNTLNKLMVGYLVSGLNPKGNRSLENKYLIVLVSNITRKEWIKSMKIKHFVLLINWFLIIFDY